MYLLEEISLCSADFKPLWSVVGTIIKAVWIGIPILLIVLGSIDLGKAVIASKEDEVKKAKKSFINRLLYAVLVFAVVWIVRVIISSVSKLGFTGDVDTTSWTKCWEMIK